MCTMLSFLVQLYDKHLDKQEMCIEENSDKRVTWLFLSVINRISSPISCVRTYNELSVNHKMIVQYSWDIPAKAFV
jgi:hypothetical protein